MKKILLGLFLAIGLAGCGVKTELPVAPVMQEEARVTVVLDFGDEVATYSTQLNNESTVLSALQEVSDREGLKMTSKTYDFGVLVTGIDGKENSANRAWIYYLNGNSGEVGAGEAKIHSGDLVEWKYRKPIY